MTAFSDRVRAAAGEQGRLPMPEQVMWEIFPFEPDSLVVKPLEPDVVPEPPRGGEGERACWRCSDPDAGVVWSDERWVIATMGEQLRLPFAAMLMPREHLDLGELDDDLAADLGRLIVLVDRAVRRLPDVERCHVNKWGDGGAHQHVAFLGRPTGMAAARLQPRALGGHAPAGAAGRRGGDDAPGRAGARRRTRKRPRVNDLHDAIRAAWNADTCDPADLPWSPDNPSRGQCGVTALVLNDLLGGELLVAEVRRDDGTRHGVHYWNRLPDGTEVDLTRGQFAPHEHVGEAQVVARPAGPPTRCREQYDLLRARVAQPPSTVASASSGPSSARNSR